MGVFFSRFRTKLSTKEVLEEIEKKLKSIDEFQQDTMERQKRVARRLLVIFVLVYIIAIMAFVFISTVQKFKLYFFTGLVAFALLCWVFHRGLKWHYNRQLVCNSEKSVELRKKKKKILEEVMDTETYKVAKEILDRFGDKPQQPTLQEMRRTPMSMNRPTAPGTELRQRQVPQANAPVRTNAPPQPPATPMNLGNSMKSHQPQQQQQQQQQQHMLSTQRPVAMNYGQPPVRPLPRPILPRERGLLDRMMDFIVGDGPHQRYALICRHCGGHNGMALQEEFEFVSYNCCYCYQFNPPRKMRPMGPRLAVPPPQPNKSPTPATKPMGESKSEPILTEAKPDDSDQVTKPGSKSEGSAETPSLKDEDESSASESESEEEGSEKMEVDVQEGDSAISDGHESSSLR